MTQGCATNPLHQTSRPAHSAEGRRSLLGVWPLGGQAVFVLDVGRCSVVFRNLLDHPLFLVFTTKALSCVHRIENLSSCISKDFWVRVSLRTVHAGCVWERVCCAQKLRLVSSCFRSRISTIWAKLLTYSFRLRPTGAASCIMKTVERYVQLGKELKGCISFDFSHFHFIASLKPGVLHRIPQNQPNGSYASNKQQNAGELS